MIRRGEEFLHGNAKRARESLEIIQANVRARALERADVGPMQTAAFRQLLLRPPAHKAQEPQLPRKLDPCLPLHGPISLPPGRAVYSARTAKRWRYATSCSAFAAFVVLTLGGCAAPAAATPSAGLPADIARATKSACTRTHDCAVVGIGARACGGPADHLVYSRVASDVSALMRAVTRYNTAEAERLRRAGVMSTCETIPAPAVACTAGHCRAVAPGDGRLPLAPQ